MIAGAWVTTQGIIAGYLLAIVVSVPLALSVAYPRFVENAIYPLVEFLQIIPKIAIAPLFIIWFCFDFAPKLLLVFLLSFFPIVVASIAGFKSVDPEIMDFAHTTGAGAWKMLRNPPPAGASRYFHRAKGRRRAVRDRPVVAEFVASDRGLGYLLLQYNGNLESPSFAIVVLLSLIGLAVYYLVELIERIIRGCVAAGHRREITTTRRKNRGGKDVTQIDRGQRRPYGRRLHRQSRRCGESRA